MFFYAVLDALNDGRIIRRAVQTILRVIAWLTVALALLSSIQGLKEAFRAEGSLATVGGLLLTLLMLGTTACVFQIYYYRAQSIEQLGQSDYTVIPIVSILLRMTGEIIATFLFGVVAVGLCIATWLAGPEISSLWSSIGPSWGRENTFVRGFSLFGWGLLCALLTIIFFYFLAEATVVFADMARHIRTMAEGRTHGGSSTADRVSATAPPPRPAATPQVQTQADHARPMTEAAPTPPQSGPRPDPLPASSGQAHLKCPACGARNDRESAFCAECGGKL